MDTAWFAFGGLFVLSAAVLGATWLGSRLGRQEREIRELREENKVLWAARAGLHVQLERERRLARIAEKYPEAAREARQFDEEN